MLFLILIVKYIFRFRPKMAGLFRFRLFFGRKRTFIFRLFLFYGRKSKIHFRSAAILNHVISAVKIQLSSSLLKHQHSEPYSSTGTTKVSYSPPHHNEQLTLLSIMKTTAQATVVAGQLRLNGGNFTIHRPEANYSALSSLVYLAHN